MLEIARQSVPDGYGNSYFWVKPPRIVPRRPGARRRRPARLHRAPRCGRSTRSGARAVARWFRDAGHRHARRLLPARLRQPRPRGADARRSCAEEHPDAVVSISQRGAAGVPRVRARDDHPRRRRGEAAAGALRHQHQGRGSTDAGDRTVPFYVMKSNGGVLSADEVVHQPITTVLSGPAAGALGAALIARGRRLRQGAHLRRRRHVDRRLGRHRRRADADHRGHGRRLPAQDPDDRRRHRRRRRRLDRLALARGHAQGRPAVGRRRPRPALLRPRAAPSVTITDAHVVLGRIPPHLLGGEIPLDVDAARAGSRRWPSSSGSSPEACATGILEISAWNQANALRQVTVKRGLDVRDFTLTTFGGSGSLLLCRLVDILGLPARAGAARTRATCRRSGCSPSTSRTTTCRRHVALHDATSTPADRRRRRTTTLAGAGRRGADQGGLRRRRSTGSCAPPTCATSARPSRCGCRCPTARSTEPRSTSVADAFHAEHTALYGYDFSGDRRQQVEWVNLRVSGIGPIAAARDPPRLRAAGGRRRRRSDRRPAGVLRRRRRVRRHPGLLARRPARRARRVDGPGGHRGVRLDGAAAPRLHAPASTALQPHRDPRSELA